MADGWRDVPYLVPVSLSVASCPLKLVNLALVKEATAAVVVDDDDDCRLRVQNEHGRVQHDDGVWRRGRRHRY